MPQPRLAGASLDVQATASGLESASTIVKQGPRELANEVRESQVTLAAKNRAIDSYDRVFRSVATVLTGLFVLSDQDALAQRVRPSLRRPGRTATEEGEEAATLG